MSKAKLIPIHRLIPSMITILALCLGITSIRYSLDGKYSVAVALIVIAAFLDGLDGRVARLLKSSSKFGAQLDSLADLCSFGIAPGIAIYLWSLHFIPYKGIGWGVVLFYITCSALRLARFNVQSADDIEEGTDNNSNFFTGLPMPAAAGLLMIPIMLTFALVDALFFTSLYWYMASYVIFLGFLMISNIPIYSAKSLNINKKRVKIVLIIMGMLFATIILEPWIVLPILGMLYLILIPLGVFYGRKIYEKDNI